MRTLTCLLLIFSLVSCQKEVQLPKFPKKAQVPKPVPSAAPEPEPEPKPQPEPQDSIYREEPMQEIDFYEFATMLRDNKQYKIVEHFEVIKDLWNEVPIWIKDDLFTFHQSGDAWADTQIAQHPSVVSDLIKLHWTLYADDEGIKLDWIDSDYKVKTYLVVAYELDKSFILAENVAGRKVFFTYSFVGEN